jgi:hypothetical protein
MKKEVQIVTGVVARGARRAIVDHIAPIEHDEAPVEALDAEQLMGDDDKRCALALVE